MQHKIWSSLPLHLLKEAIRDAGLSDKNLFFLKKDDEIKQAEIIFGVIPLKYRGHLASVNKNLRWIQLDSVDSSYLKVGAKIKVTNTRGVFSRMIAESILGSLLADARGLDTCWQTQQKRQWQRWPIRAQISQLTGKTILFLGGGSITEEVISLLKPFRCEIIIFRRQSKKVNGVKMITDKSHLRKWLKASDIIINTLPATEQTNYFLSSALLRVVSPKAVFINVGRGSTVDEKALLARLRVKKIRKVILDVTQQEPIPSSSPLWRIPNLWLTQHTMGGHRDELKMKCSFFAENLKRYLSAQPLLNRISS